MAKKDKGNRLEHRHQANAPEYHQILQSASYQQPAHNPYYPDQSVNLLPPASVPPPPYSISSVPLSSSSAARNSVPMSYVQDINYPRLHPGTSPVVIQSPGVAYDHRADRYRRKVRSFNSQTIIFSVFSIILAIWAYNLYNHRSCFDEFVVHKIDKNLEFKISDVRNHHLNVAFTSGFVILVCLLKSAIGFKGKSHGCYLFIIVLISFFMCLHNGYLTYLAYYSPCVASISNVAANIGKSFVSQFVDNLPAPDKNFFGESNVIVEAKRDPNGLAIFVMDAMNFACYFVIFISSALLC